MVVHGVLEYGISDDEAFSVGLACGGKIRILVEPVGIEMPVEMLEALVAARTLRQKVAYVVNLHDWTRHLTDGGFAGRFSHDLSGVEPDGITFVNHSQSSLATCYSRCSAHRSSVSAHVSISRI